MVAKEIKIVKGVAELVLIIKVEDNLIVAKKKKQVGAGRKKKNHNTMILNKPYKSHLNS